MKFRSFLTIAIATVSLYSCKKTDDNTTINTVDANEIYSIAVNGTPEAGNIIAAPFTFTEAGGMLMIMDNIGNVVKSKSIDEGRVFCFKKWDLNGTIRYTYIVDDASSYHIPNINQATGYVVIADEDLNEIKKVNLLPYNGITIDQAENLDVHDFILLSDDHYYTMTYYEKKVTNIPSSITHSADVKIVAPIIQEVQNGSVVWQWDGSNNPEFYDYSVEGNDYTNEETAQDYMHMNSMFVDPRDNNMILSFRHMDMIIKIEKTTGNVLWRLGGKNSDFPLTEEQKFLRQHDATLINNDQTLLFFDNGHITDRPYSRVIELTLDETGKTVTNFSSYTINKPFAQYMGSVQKINDNYFIGGGTGNYILEVNSLTEDVILDMDATMTTYRANKY